MLKLNIKNIYIYGVWISDDISLLLKQEQRKPKLKLKLKKKKKKGWA